MGYRYTMVDFDTFKDQFELRCFDNDVCVLTKAFDSNTDALTYGDKFLNKEIEEELIYD